MHEIVYKRVDELIPYARNARTHSDEQVAQIAASIREFGFNAPVLIDGQGGIIAGHGRVMAARKLGMDSVPTIALPHLSEVQKRACILADNKLALNSEWDNEMLQLELEEIAADGLDISLAGFSDDEFEGLLEGVDSGDDLPFKDDENGSLFERFMIPPFSVLSARDGWWVNRKRAWLALGMRSELGRDDAMTFRTDGDDEVSKKIAIKGGDSGTSVFDPVLCEIVYRWFLPAGGTVIDPFAGGSVRGIVASKLGARYIGHELREEQVSANRAQADGICADDPNMPIWICGDSMGIDRTCADVEADMVFSCPPYADLEVYSDNPSDLSNMSYADFRAAYFKIIEKACSLLKNDRFACFVVGEVRDKKGNYYDFVGDTVQAFKEAGLNYYNEAILVTQAGSLPLRAGRQFSLSRKMGKTHQNVLIFVKGDGKRAAIACGDVDVSDSLQAVSCAEGCDSLGD